MSTFLRIPLPGALPQLTIFRLVLLMLFFAWLRRPRTEVPASPIPCSGSFWFWALANLASLLLTSVAFVGSLKRYLDFVLEVWGFYLLLITSLRTREDALKILHAAVAGLGVVAFLAFIEKYSGFNPVNYLVPADEDGTVMLRDVTATYQHRILLGTGMAMGLPLAAVLAMRSTRFNSRRFWWALVLLFAAGCYFAQSRGPWIGVILAGMVLFVLGSGKLRQALLWPALLTVLVLLARPGVYATLSNTAKVTADTDSFKGGTFKYRLELWKVAWHEVIQSPVRLLFGYGPGCGVERNVDWQLSYRGSRMDVWSWDNHYAYDLYQSGCVGLAARLTLYFGVIVVLYRFYRSAPAGDRDLFTALLASAAVMVFMMSNVLIFSKQLNFLFWALSVVGLVLGRHPVSAEGEDLGSYQGLSQPAYATAALAPR